MRVINAEFVPAIASRHGPSVPKRVLLGEGLPSVPQVAIAEVPGATETESHIHPTMYEVYFILEGLARFWVGEETFEVTAEDFFIVPPNTPHHFSCPGSLRMFYFGVALS